MKFGLWTFHELLKNRNILIYCLFVALLIRFYFPCVFKFLNSMFTFLDKIEVFRWILKLCFTSQSFWSCRMHFSTRKMTVLIFFKMKGSRKILLLWYLFFSNRAINIFEVKYIALKTELQIQPCWKQRSFLQWKYLCFLQPKAHFWFLTSHAGLKSWSTMELLSFY